MAQDPDKVIDPFFNVRNAEMPPSNGEERFNSEASRGMREVSVGAGARVFRADERGIWLGAETFEDAPFKVSMEGIMSAQGAIIAGYKLFEAVVGASGADYTTVAAALAAGKTRIFVRNGTYAAEPIWTISNPNTIIQGESLGGVSITFAQDVTNQRSIYWNASRCTILNLSLVSYETANQTLIHFGSAAQFPVVQNCVLRNRRYRVFDGGAASLLYGTFDNLYIDFLAALDAPAMKGFYGVSNSIIRNVIIDMDFVASGFNPVEGCGNSYFIGCQFKQVQANEFTISNSGNCFFTSCYFYAYMMRPNANFVNCYLQNNGNSPAGYFLTIDVSSVRFNNNRVKLGTADNVLAVAAANVQVNDNLFDGGKAMDFENTGVASIVGLQFCNNQWVSPYTVAAMNILLGTVGHTMDNSNLIGNVIRNNSNSFVPTITNNSANCNVQYNQLIQG